MGCCVCLAADEVVHEVTVYADDETGPATLSELPVESVIRVLSPTSCRIVDDVAFPNFFKLIL